MPSKSEDRLAAAQAYEFNDDEPAAGSSRASPHSHSNSDSPAPIDGLEPSSWSPNGRKPPQSADTTAPIATTSQYRIRPSEKFRGVANRIIFSRYYIGFYFIMMSLSLTTVILSLKATHQHQCPPVAWHILEVIVNALMVVEVSTRWVAYGKKYPMTPLNIIDLLLVLFCSVTLILVFKSPCSEGTRKEEVLDTIVLVIRNAVQFLRLGNILRRSGHSLFNPPKPIDLSQARTASLALDLDLDLDDEEAVAERHLAGSRRSLAGGGSRVGYEPLFQDEEAEIDNFIREHDTERTDGTRKPLDLPEDQGRGHLTEADEEAWDRMS